MSWLSQTFFVVVLGFAFFGCEDKKEANLYKAQDCLNKAVPATATACLDFIASQTSERSYVIRCSVTFLAEGIDEVAIVNALTNIDGSKGGDPTSATIAALAMSTPAAASEALNFCTLSGSKSLSALAGFANISTVLNIALGLGVSPTSAEIEAALAAYAGGASNKTDLGNAVLASQDSLCNPTTGLFKNDPACADINQAVAANPNDPAALADALIANLGNQSN